MLTTRLLEPHLGEPGVALDLGGGTGPYSVWLSELGWDVTLADLSPDLLAIARESCRRARPGPGPGRRPRPVAVGRRHVRRVVASAVLPPDHRTTGDGCARARAGHAPGGLVAVALVPRYGLVRRVLALADERGSSPTRRSSTACSRRRARRTPARFTHRTGSPRGAPFFEAHGFSTVTLASTHGFLTGVEDGLEALRLAHPAAYLDLLDRLVATADDPAVLGTAGHLLYVGRRRPSEVVDDRRDRVRVPQDPPVAEAVAHPELGVGPGLRDPLAVGGVGLLVRAVRDDEERRQVGASGGALRDARARSSGRSARTSMRRSRRWRVLSLNPSARANARVYSTGSAGGATRTSRSVVRAVQHRERGRRGAQRVADDRVGRAVRRRSTVSIASISSIRLLRRRPSATRARSRRGSGRRR